MTGLKEILWKELSDCFNSKRFVVLFLLIYIAGIATVYIASQNIRTSVDESTKYIFLNLFTTSGSSNPFSFPLFMSIFIPIIGIALGFDAVNSERTSGNLSRLLAQPVYRDAVINGKFLAGVIMMALMIFSMVILVSGLGLRMIGVPPQAEEILRLFTFIVISILYGAFWMSLAILFSVLFRKTSTSALTSIAIWMFLFLFGSLIAALIAGAVTHINTQTASVNDIMQFDSLFRMLSRVSPGTLYSESIQAILLPSMGTSSPTMMVIGIYSGLTPTPLPLIQSLLIVWPQIVALVALTAVCFAIAYIKFMREEIRAS
ncbi:MAG: ABC transporter permease subunit [Dehalococcoidia bacterium]|jgi:ABC-2 type transport system permease protein